MVIINFERATVKKHLVTGATGQVGGALCKLLGDKATGIDHQDIDFTQPDTIKAKLAEYKPDIIINPAAYTAVDQCEEEEVLAQKINADAVEKLAEYAFEQGIPFVHYSTDYVFPGTGEASWKEVDETGPVNAYGRTKLAGEQAIQEVAERFDNPEWLILRTSWVYAEEGKNFVNTMLRLGKEKEVISVINDQVGTPTYSHDIADYTLKILDKTEDTGYFPSGIYHFTNRGITNWHDFAEEIFRQASAQGEELVIKDVKEIRTKDYPTLAQRPLNSRLDCSKLEEVFGLRFPAWEDALCRCLKKRRANQKAAA